MPTCLRYRVSCQYSGSMPTRPCVQIDKFRKYWPGPLLWDTTKSFYRALGNGKLTRGKMVPLLNPFSQVLQSDLDPWNVDQCKQIIYTMFFLAVVGFGS